MEFRILGPLYADAGTGKGPAVISQPLLQSALAVLLLRANRPCPRAMLIEALWVGEPPSSPEAALRVCISRLRHALGECASRLESVGPPGGRAPGHRQQRGYMMTVRPGELDVDEFTDLAAQGQAELYSGNALAATTSFVQALSLWGDPPLPDLPDSHVIAPDLARLADQRQSVLDALMEARLAGGQHEQALAQLRVVAAASPGREVTTSQLMRAYQALGMRREALDAYHVARRAMLELQGAEPGTALSMMYRRILAEEEAAGAAAGQGNGRIALALRGSQAPPPPTDFTGRAAETAAVVEVLTGPGTPVAVITGGPGAGKTTLAAVAALQLREQFPDGQLYAELGGVEHPRDPQDVLADLLQSIGISSRSVPPPGPPRSALYRSVLAGRRVLVIADDAATAAQVRPLLPAPGGAAVLVTSRCRLGGLAGAAAVQIGPLPAHDAISLLGLVAGAERVAAEPAAARAVVAACGGLPLAVRLAGTTLATRPGLTVTQLASDLTGSRVLELGHDDSSVAAAIASSYRAVPRQVRAVLTTAAAILPGDIPGWALTELAGADATAADRLAAVGLLAPARTEAFGQHYELQPLVRAFACQAGNAGGGNAGLGTGALTRLRLGWLRRAARAAARTPAHPFVPAVRTPAPESADEQWLGEHWLTFERANLLAVAAHSATAGASQDAVVLAGTLAGHLCRAGRHADAIESCRAIARAATSAGDSLSQERASYYLAAVLADSHDGARNAATLLAACVPALEQAGDLGTAAMGWSLLGRCASADGRHALALRSARRAISLAAGLPDGPLVRCCALAVLGLTFARIGLPAVGVGYCRQAVAQARAAAESGYEVHSQLSLAQALMLGGEYAEAAGLCQEAAQLARAYGSEVEAARSLLLLGLAEQRRSRDAAATVSLRAAIAVFSDAGLVLDEATARTVLTASCSGEAARTELHELAQFLAEHGVSDPAASAAAAGAACEPPVTPLMAG